MDTETSEGVDASFSEQITNQHKDQDEDQGQSQRQGEGQCEDREVGPAEMMVMSGAIPHILERIVGYLPLENQKECRLINSDWNQAAVLQLRKILPFIRLYNDREVGIKSFLDCVKDTEVSPFAKFMLYLSNRNVLEPSTPLLGMLFQTIAAVATDFKIHYSIHMNTKEKSDWYWFDMEINKKLEYPFLKVLKLDISYDYLDFSLPNEKVDQELQPLLQVLEKSPKLQELDWDFQQIIDDDLSNFVLHQLIGSMEKKRNNCLTHLQLRSRSTEIEDRHFLRLSRLGLRLKSFTLEGKLICLDADGEVNYEGECGKEFIDFLHSQSDSLEKLKLIDFLGVFDEMEFPSLKRLTTLKVREWKPRRDDFRATPKIDYSRSFPVLKKLDFGFGRFSQDNLNWVHFLPDPTSTPAPSVTELRLPIDTCVYRHYDYDGYEPYLLHAAKYFANLKILLIPANRKLVNILHSWAPQLEELILRIGQDPIDDIITGLSLEGYRLIRLFSGRMFPRFETDMGNLNLHNGSMQPLSSLKCLKILRLDRPLGMRAIEVSTISTRLVLTKMPSLEVVDFGKFGYSSRYDQQLRDDVFKDLRKSGKLVLYEYTGTRCN